MIYKNFLKKNIFKTDEYDQFNLLFNDFEKINKMKLKHVMILERSHIYNGFSIFSPLIKTKTISVVDYRFKNISNNRVGYQYNWIKDSRYNFVKSKYLITDCFNSFNFNFKKNDCEFLLIPNVLHHCSDFQKMLKNLLKRLPKIKYIYIFDSSLRETHQYPFDYARHTPSSIKNIMFNFKFKNLSLKETGNAFDVLLYFISQSKKILANKENSYLNNQIKKIVPELKRKRKLKKWQNLGRKYAKLNSAFSMIFEKT
tara:strand:+ start:236 stop:1003 length:768 start_codon:yes stop_codon:yes gene_type:complete